MYNTAQCIGKLDTRLCWRKHITYIFQYDFVISLDILYL